MRVGRSGETQKSRNERNLIKTWSASTGVPRQVNHLHHFLGVPLGGGFFPLLQLPWWLSPKVPSGSTRQCLRRSDRRGADTLKRPGAVLFSGTTQSIDTAPTVLVLPARRHCDGSSCSATAQTPSDSGGGLAATLLIGSGSGCIDVGMPRRVVGWAHYAAPERKGSAPSIVAVSVQFAYTAGSISPVGRFIREKRRTRVGARPLL